MLTDIAVEHEYKGRKVPAPVRFILHPYSATEGEHAGLYEVLRSQRGSGEEQVRSAFVTRAQLAELYARQYVERLGLRLRMAPAAGVAYPDSLPGKKVPRDLIPKGCEFDREVLAVDRARQVSEGVRAIVAQLEAPLAED
jgi:hypothetical protein